MIEGISDYYRTVETKQGLSKEAEIHFKRKLCYLKEKNKILSIWDIIKYFFDLNDFDIKDKKVLDVGCGTGYTSIYFSTAGAKEVVGVDLKGSKIDAFKAFVSFLPENFKNKIKIIKSRTQNMEFTNNFDLIFAQEATSHIVDDHLFERFYETLGSNGILFISDGNNELCAKYRRMIYKYWERIENGPKGTVLGCHTEVEFVYKKLRRDLITKQFGDKLNSNEINLLAENTVYLWGKGLTKAVGNSIKTGFYPSSKYVYGTTPIHPELGYYIEKLFNPYELKKKLLSIGFKSVKLYGFQGLAHPLLKKYILDFIPLRIKYHLRSSFYLIAKKGYR